MKATRVLGVDPGTRVVGWAVLEQFPGERPRRLESGILNLGNSKATIPDRLLRLRFGIQSVMRAWSPDFLALEAAFFGKNARSALRLGEARGTVMVTAEEAGLEVAELPPAVIKRRVAGAGNATKEQVAELLRLQLELPAEFASEDESDAIAVALCALLESVEPGRKDPGSPRKRGGRGMPSGAHEM
jgi:crossover junction endodeoxyribonuclease RuvC